MMYPIVTSSGRRIFSPVLMNLPPLKGRTKAVKSNQEKTPQKKENEAIKRGCNDFLIDLCFFPVQSSKKVVVRSFPEDKGRFVLV